MLRRSSRVLQWVEIISVKRILNFMHLRFHEMFLK